ncbi:MAG: DNA-3-methyladenine glycosylase I [Candidatus Bathyarchaeia archaeon]|jgi:DNA-3-methyladenine glycosylase I
MDDQQNWTSPEWAYLKNRPLTDDAYFENLTRAVFNAGLNWKTIDVKWGVFKRAFKNFSIEEVAKFTEKDEYRLMEDPGIVRNRAKIAATIFNARQMVAIRSEFGSFQEFLDGLDKCNKYSKVIEDLSRRFKHIGKSTAEIFLWSVGEDIEQCAH